MILRLALASDAASLVMMRADTDLQHLLMATPSTDVPADRLADTQAWLDRRSAAGWFRIVLDDEGQTVGFAQITEIHNKNRLGWLGISLLPTARGKGLATRALAKTENAAKNELGLRKLLLQVRADNLPASRLYDNSEWHLVGCLRAQYDDGTMLHDAFVYEKLLDAV